MRTNAQPRATGTRNETAPLTKFGLSVAQFVLPGWITSQRTFSGEINSRKPATFDRHFRRGTPEDDGNDIPARHSKEIGPGRLSFHVNDVRQQEPVAASHGFKQGAIVQVLLVSPRTGTNAVIVVGEWRLRKNSKIKIALKECVGV